jgi:short-subunit dehydrogenase
VGDVSDPDAMEDVANAAIGEFGAFDTWVNNAGTGAYGRMTQMSLADKRRIFDVNFWGVVHGCRAAVRHLRDHGGAIVNIGSVASDLAISMLGIYSASKHAVKGYTDALRMELEQDGLQISVSLVKPSSINTPFLEHARTEMEAEPEVAPPVYAPEEVVRAILRCAEEPIRDVTVGGGGRMLSMMGTVAPRLTDAYLERVVSRQQMKDEAPRSRDALYTPQSDARRRGPTGRRTVERSAYTRAALSDVGRALPVLALGALVAAAAARR